MVLSEYVIHRDLYDSCQQCGVDFLMRHDIFVDVLEIKNDEHIFTQHYSDLQTLHVTNKSYRVLSRFYNYTL